MSRFHWLFPLLWEKFSGFGVLFPSSIHNYLLPSLSYSSYITTQEMIGFPLQLKWKGRSWMWKLLRAHKPQIPECRRQSESIWWWWWCWRIKQVNNKEAEINKIFNINLLSLFNFELGFDIEKDYQHEEWGSKGIKKEVPWIFILMNRWLWKKWNFFPPDYFAWGQKSS